MSVYEKFSKAIENRDADALIDCIAILDQKNEFSNASKCI